MTDEELHEQAVSRFKKIEEFESAERQKMVDDKEFLLIDQWDSKHRRSRELGGREALTVKRVNQFTDHVKNNNRQSKPSIKISPTDEGAQERQAELRQGLIRHIQYDSKAEQARQQAFNEAVDEGRGHYIIKTDWVAPGSFDKKILIEPIKIARSVYMDISRERPDYSDCKYGFIVKSVDRDLFEEKYPDADVVSWRTSENLDDKDSSNTVMLAEYYYETIRERTLLHIQKGDQTRIMFEDEMVDKKKKDLKGFQIIAERKVEWPEWKWCELSGKDVLKKEDLPWSAIPIVTVIGKENIVDGEWSCKGLVRDIKDPLRVLDLTVSTEAELIAKAPRTPWVMAEGQDEDHEDEWADSNWTDVPKLSYKPVTVNGTLAPPPQRAQFSIDLHNLQQQKMNLIEDVKAITGIYDASVGNRSNETSGVAIRAREAQGDAANFHFTDNMAMAIGHEARVINDALPIIYDTARTIQIMGEDDEREMEKINADEEEELGPVGSNFSVTVEVGPSFNTQRQEQAAGMMEMFGNSGLLQEGAVDLVIGAQDWNNKDALSKRAEGIIDMKYPGLIAKTKQKGKEEELQVLQSQLAQSQQQLQQAGQQMQQLQEALQKSNADKNRADAGKVEIDMQKLGIEQQKLQLEAKKIEAEIALEEKKLRLDAEKASMDVEKDLEINDKKLEVDLIKVAQDGKQAEQAKIEPVKEEKKEAKSPPITLNIDNGSGKKVTKITKDSEGNYTAETVVNEG